MITNQKLEEPFNKGPPDGPLPKLANSFVNTARPTRQVTAVTPTSAQKKKNQSVRDSGKKKQTWPLQQFVNPAPYIRPNDVEASTIKRLVEDEQENFK